MPNHFLNSSETTELFIFILLNHSIAGMSYCAIIAFSSAIAPTAQKLKTSFSMLELLRIGSHLESFLKVFHPKLKLLRWIRWYREIYKVKFPKINLFIQYSKAGFLFNPFECRELVPKRSQHYVHSIRYTIELSE